MAVTHKLKCWSDYYDAVERGDKTFEVRRDDRGFQKGDILHLEKYDPKERRYILTGSAFSDAKSIKREITYVLTGGHFGIEPGYVVLGFK